MRAGQNPFKGQGRRDDRGRPDTPKAFHGDARSCGVSKSTFWKFVRESQSGDERYLIRFMSDEPIQFAAATVAARRVHYHNVRSTLERRALVGDAEVVTFGGRVMWAENPATVGWTPAEREMCGYPADGLLRNERGETIPLTVQRPPPTALVLRLMEVAFRSEWTPSQNVNQNTTVNVRQYNGAAFAKPPTGRPVIPPPPPIPSLEILGDVVAEPVPIDATANEPASDAVTDTPP